MRIYKRYSVETKHMYFMIKDEKKKKDKYMTNRERVSNIIQQYKKLSKS